MRISMQQARKMAEKQAAKLGLVGAAALVFVNNAMAAVSADVTTAISDAKADGITVAGGIFLVVLAIAVWRHLRGAK